MLHRPNLVAWYLDSELGTQQHYSGELEVNRMMSRRKKQFCLRGTSMQAIEAWESIYQCA